MRIPGFFLMVALVPTLALAGSWKLEDVKSLNSVSMVLMNPAEGGEWISLSKRKDGKRTVYEAGVFEGQRPMHQHAVKSELFDLLYGQVNQFWDRESKFTEHPPGCRPKTKIAVRSEKKLLYEGFVCNDKLLPTSERELAALYRLIKMAAKQK